MGGFLIHPPGDIGFARNADGIALILIAKSPKQVINLVIHLGNSGLIQRASTALWRAAMESPLSGSPRHLGWHPARFEDGRLGARLGPLFIELRLLPEVVWAW